MPALSQHAEIFTYTLADMKLSKMWHLADAFINISKTLT